MSATVQTVLVTGAAGGVGRAVSHLLREQGLRVRGLVRPEDNLRGLGIPAPDLTFGYVEDPAAVARALEGADAVINCAALLPNALALGAAAFERVNVAGPLNVLRQAGLRGLRRAAFFSTISVVDHVGRRVTPATLFDYVPGPHDVYLASKIRSERALRAAAPHFPGAVAVLRPAFIYGPGNYAVWADGLDLLRRGKMRLIGGGGAALPLIHARDIARFLLLWLRRGGAGPSFDVYTLASTEPTTIADVFNFLADRLGVPRPGRVPYPVALLACSLVGLLPAAWRPGRLRLLTRARVRQYSRGYDLSGVLEPPPLGFRAPTGYREGLAEMVEDYLARLREAEVA